MPGTVKDVINNNVIHQSLNQTVMRALSKIVNTSNSLDDDLETIKLWELNLIKVNQTKKPVYS